MRRHSVMRRNLASTNMASNSHVRSLSDCTGGMTYNKGEPPFLSDTVRRRRLSFYGHLSRADPWQDHYRALQACITGPHVEWRRRTGRPRQTWLRTVETNEPWPGINQTMCTGQSGMTTTRDNGYVHDKPLKREREPLSEKYWGRLAITRRQILRCNFVTQRNFYRCIRDYF